MAGRCCDSEGTGDYQRRVWVDKILPSPGYYDDFNQTIHVLYDDCQVLPDPEGRIGSVLIDGEEVDQFRALGVELDAVIADHGGADDAVYLADSRWPAVTSAASRALAAMTRAWGFEWPS